NIAFDASKLINMYFNTFLTMNSDKNVQTWRLVEFQFREIGRIKKELHQLVGDDPEALGHMIKVEEQIEKLDKWIQRGIEVMRSGEGYRDYKVGEALAGRDKLIPQVIGVAHRIQKVIDDAEAQEFLSPEKQKELRQRQGQILFAGLAANILASILLALFFTKDVTSRLTILADNADRLAKEKELNPQLLGSDEIAQLDRVFHVTAMALDEARHKERAVFDNSQDIVCAVSADGRFTSMNPASEKMFGYTKEEMLGKTILNITHPDDVESTTQTLLGDFGGLSRISFENRVLKKDGTMIYVLWSASRQKGEPTIYCIAHDISNRKELEALKQEFLAMVSHDLRTPLTSITGVSKLIGAGAFGKVEAKPLQILDSINSNSDKLLELINDLLDIEKLESGHMQLVVETVPLKELVEQSVANAPKGAAIKIEFYGDKPGIEIDADRDRLTQALGNILTHAVGRSKGAPVRFLSRNTADAIEMQIIDTAPAMSEKMRTQLFDRFKDMSGLENASAEERMGTGLALPIAHKIIESHSGTVSVIVQGEVGNSYYIRIPLVQAPAKASSAAAT
ncbi:MAG: PAS domain-containing sensor histidine kinase, partial [Candidatus Obscuribacterales bacterium]|nr:PAS domain-containing sensor histidine kinase [Candidatus Obscuribacterales bacterium]